VGTTLILDFDARVSFFVEGPVTAISTNDVTATAGIATALLRASNQSAMIEIIAKPSSMQSLPLVSESKPRYPQCLRLPLEERYQVKMASCGTMV